MHEDKTLHGLCMRDRCAITKDLGNHSVSFHTSDLGNSKRDVISEGLDPGCLLRRSLMISSHGFISHDANLRFYNGNVISFQQPCIRKLV